jgi:serine/threonine protein kinase
VTFAPAITDSSRATGRRYEPIAQIGRGGMAEVLLALMDSGAGARRLAVLKRIGPELATDPDFVEMFLDEARLSLRLSHANVVQTYEVLVGDDELAIAMEYLDGQPLTRVLNRMLRGPGELGLPLRLRILTRVLAGLEHAHTLADLDGTPLGVVHRDVSPQNVFVTYDGQVKLVDFGVAKTIAASHQTRPGAIKGKLAYMAPEQLQSEVVDRRADLFSVGVMLWEMLAQRRMWHRMTEIEIVGHLASGRPMPSLPVLPADVPTDLDAICMRALETDPALRYQTAAEMEIDLERVLAGAADSHARNLGTVVSLAFAAERAERQAVIERCLRRSAEQAVPASVVPDPLPTIDVPLEALDEDRTPAREAVDRGTSDATPVLRVNPALSAPSASPAHPAPAAPSISEAHSMHVTPPDPPPSLAVSAAQRALRIWRAAAVAGMVATVAALSLALAWRRGPDARAVPAHAAGVTAAPPVPSPAAPPRDPEPRPQSTRAIDAAGREEAEHPRRHRRPKHVDEDAVMPPTGSDDES